MLPFNCICGLKGQTNNNWDAEADETESWRWNTCSVSNSLRGPSQSESFSSRLSRSQTSTSFNRDAVKAGTGRRFLGGLLDHTSYCYTLEVSFYSYIIGGTTAAVPYTEEACILSRSPTIPRLAFIYPGTSYLERFTGQVRSLVRMSVASSIGDVSDLHMEHRCLLHGFFQAPSFL